MIPDWVINPVTCDMRRDYTNQVTPVNTFMNDNGGIGQLVEWQTDDEDHIGIYTIDLKMRGMC